jgi:hypothetical protein
VQEGIYTRARGSITASQRPEAERARYANLRVCILTCNTCKTAGLRLLFVCVEYGE